MTSPVPVRSLARTLTLALTLALTMALSCASTFVVAAAAEQPPADESAPAPAPAASASAAAATADDREAIAVQMTARLAPQKVPSRRGPPFSISAHVQFGRLSQSSSESFNAILGSSSGQAFGAGAELALRSGMFVRADMSYFSGDGERVEIIDGEVVQLGIPLSISLTPIEFSGGYRLPAYVLGRRDQVRLVPFVGAGVGVVRYREETDAEHPDEHVSERFTSYHVLVGLDVPLGRRVAVGAEATRRWVPDGLGTGGVSEALGETDLGGSTFLLRIRIIF